MTEFPSDNRWPKTPGIEQAAKRVIDADKATDGRCHCRWLYQCQGEDRSGCLKRAFFDDIGRPPRCLGSDKPDHTQGE